MSRGSNILGDPIIWHLLLYYPVLQVSDICIAHHKNTSLSLVVGEGDIPAVWSHYVFYWFLTQAQHEINEGDIPAARRHWVTACQWPYFGMVIWIAIVLPFVMVGLITGIALGVVLSQ